MGVRHLSPSVLSFAVLLSFATSVAVSASLAPQEESLPVVAIASRVDLVRTLSGSPFLDESSVRLGLLAAQGSAIGPFLRQVLRDENEAAIIRENAISVLGLMLDSSDVSTIVEYASRTGPIQNAALNALTHSPYPAACVFWRAVLLDPSSHSSAPSVVLTGIRYCGSEDDVPLVRRFLQWDRSFGAREVAERTMTLLGQPVADRYRLTWLEGNYPPTGTYRPPPKLAAEIRTQACGGPCPVGAVLSPAATARLRSR
jgi:hypothetical protein